MSDETKKPESKTGQAKGQKFKTDSPTMEEILRQKKPNIRKCMILLDSALSHRIDEKAAEIERLERGRSGRLSSTLADTTQTQIDQLTDELEELEREAADLSIEFSFRDLGRKGYDALLSEHPPTPEDKEMWSNAGGEGKLAYSLVTFPPALVSATSLEPKISIKEAQTMFEDWGEGDLELLFTTALMACKEPTSLPKSRAASARTRASQRNLSTALSEESPTANS